MHYLGNLVRVDEMGNPVSFEARSLSENQIYEFWVSASTSMGEGEPTAVVAQTTNTRGLIKMFFFSKDIFVKLKIYLNIAPARIASFSQVIKKPVGETLILECHAVGNPTPRARWFTRDRPVTFSPFYEVAPNGNLKIHSVEQTLSGNYTCSAKNLFGEDHVIYNVLAIKTPNAPQISVHYATADNIRISWECADNGGTPIQGFQLSYRILGTPWNRIDLPAEMTAYTIVGLKCGTQYIVKMSAMNGVGDGPASEEMNVWTKGKSGSFTFSVFC